MNNKLELHTQNKRVGVGLPTKNDLRSSEKYWRLQQWTITTYRCSTQLCVGDCDRCLRSYRISKVNAVLVFVCYKCIVIFSYATSHNLYFWRRYRAWWKVERGFASSQIAVASLIAKFHGASNKLKQWWRRHGAAFSIGTIIESTYFIWVLVKCWHFLYKCMAILFVAHNTGGVLAEGQLGRSHV